MYSLFRNKYGESHGIKDLGNPLKRKNVEGRHKEIVARKKHC